ncbi:MAG: hypothetical protein V1708_02280 [Candidatus Micrarchaeota archaeon]
MKHETKEAVKHSLAGIDETLGGVAGAHKLHTHEGMSDEEFKSHVHTITRDIISEFAEAKKRAYDEGFRAAAAKSPGEPAPLFISAPAAAPASGEHDASREIRAAERSISDKIDGLFSDQSARIAALGQADSSLHSEIRELRDDLERSKSSRHSAEGAAEFAKKLGSRLDGLESSRQELAEKLESQPDFSAKIGELSERVAKLAADSDPDRVLNLIIDNTTKVNALSRRLTSFSKRVRRSSRRAEEIYADSARKSIARRLSSARKRIEEVYSLSARKPKPAKK